MVELNQTFDPTQVEQMAGSEMIPEGWYPAQITSTEQKPTAAAKRGESQSWLVEFVHTIVGPTHTNRKIFTNLNLGNESQDAIKMAYIEFGAICNGCGTGPVQRTEQVHNIPHMIHLKVEQAVFNPDGSEKYKAKNVIKGYKPLEQQQSNAMPQPEQPTGAMPGMVNPASSDPQGSFQAPQQAPQQAQQQQRQGFQQQPAQQQQQGFQQQPAQQQPAQQQPAQQQPAQQQGFQQPAQQQPANNGRPAWEQ